MPRVVDILKDCYIQASCAIDFVLQLLLKWAKNLTRPQHCVTGIILHRVDKGPWCEVGRNRLTKSELTLKLLGVAFSKRQRPYLGRAQWPRQLASYLSSGLGWLNCRKVLCIL